MNSISSNEYYGLTPWSIEDGSRVYPNPKLGKMYRSPVGTPGVGSTINVVRVIGLDTVRNDLYHYTNPYIIKQMHIEEFNVVIS